MCACDVVKSSLKVVELGGLTFCQRFQKYLDSATSSALTHIMEKERDSRGKSKSACGKYLLSCLGMGMVVVKNQSPVVEKPYAVHVHLVKLTC